MRYVVAVLLAAIGMLVLNSAQTSAQQEANAFPNTAHIVCGREALMQAAPVGKVVDNARGFLVRLAYDEKSLYVLFEVMSPYELTNSYRDYMTVFKGGNCLDIQLGLDAQADPARKEPVPGDLRVLVTRQDGKCLAVIYRPKVKGFTGKPITFNTVNKIAFDKIEICDTIKIQEYRTFPNGFMAIVDIPLKALEWTPVPDTQIKMDVGYRFGNVTGNQIGMRAYWKTNSFNSNVTYDVPCESTLEPGLWGTAIIDPAPPKKTETKQ